MQYHAEAKLSCSTLSRARALVCDGTHYVKLYLYRYFFLVPNIFDTNTGTFFVTIFFPLPVLRLFSDTKFYQYVRRAKICGQISADMRRTFANIRIRAKICCGQISADVRRSFGKYQKMCNDLWANISSHATNFCKYQNMCKDLLWSDMSRGAKIVGKYQQTCEDHW